MVGLLDVCVHIHHSIHLVWTCVPSCRLPSSSQPLAHHSPTFLPLPPVLAIYTSSRTHTVTASSQLKSNTGLAQRYWEEDRLDTNRKRTGSTPPRVAKLCFQGFRNHQPPFHRGMGLGGELFGFPAFPIFFSFSVPPFSTCHLGVTEDELPNGRSLDVCVSGRAKVFLFR